MIKYLILNVSFHLKLSTYSALSTKPRSSVRQIASFFQHFGSFENVGFIAHQRHCIGTNLYLTEYSKDKYYKFNPSVHHSALSQYHGYM